MRTVAGIIVLATAAVFLSGCTRHDRHETAPADVASPSHGAHASAAANARRPATVKPRRGGAASMERAPAFAQWDSISQVVVTSQLGGQVRSLRLPRVGERVERGALVAELYSPQARALFAELRVAAGLGEPWLSATRRRLAVAGVPEASIDAAADGHAPDLLRLLAPASGVVVERPVNEGTWIGPGSVIAILADPSRVLVDAVASGVLPMLGSESVVSDPVTGERWNARVESVLPRGDVAGTIVRLRTEGAPRIGRPLVAEWSSPLGEGLWVPRSAVVDTGERRLVFVLDAEQGVMPRPVVLGARTADETLVQEGLDGTEDVVVAGTFLYDSETQVSGSGHAGMAMDGDRR